VSTVRSFAELRERVALKPPRVVAVAGPEGEPTLRSVEAACAAGIARCILVGDAGRTLQRLEALGIGDDGCEVVHARDEAAAARLAVRLVRAGAADILMKGSLRTSTLMQAALDRSAGLRSGRLLSDVFLFPFHSRGRERLVGITDGGVTPHPTLEQKAQILANAVELFHGLGVRRPRVAVLSAVEAATPTFPASEDALALQRMWEEGAFAACEVGGPLAMDLALSTKAARLKGLASPVAGKADVLLFPTLEAANITAKAIEYVVPVEPAHAVVGGSAPILIPSRSESAEARLNGIALGCWLAKGNA
jgi:phosphate butyryltransferase